MNKVGVAIFAYKRPGNLEELLERLQQSSRIDEVDLHIFIDGPKTINEEKAVNEVRVIANELAKAVPLSTHISLENLGLKTSVIRGVSILFSEYEKVIVLEDDLEISRYFLPYILNQLTLFENDNQVGSVTGFSELPSWYKSKSKTFYINRHCSWGWATWRDRWEAIDWNLLDNRPKADLSGLWKIGSDLPKLVEQSRHKKIDSWSIIFDANAYIHDWKCVQPQRSLVVNNGHDDSATHKQQPRNTRVNLTFAERIGQDKAMLASHRKIANFLIWLRYSPLWGFPSKQISNFLHYRRHIISPK